MLPGLAIQTQVGVDQHRCEGGTLTDDDGIVLEMSWLISFLVGRHRMGAVPGRED